MKHKAAERWGSWWHQSKHLWLGSFLGRTFRSPIPEFAFEADCKCVLQCLSLGTEELQKLQREKCLCPRDELKNAPELVNSDFYSGDQDSQAATSLSLHGTSLSLILLSWSEMWAFLPVLPRNMGIPPSSSLPRLGNFLAGDTQHNLEVSKHGANARTPHSWLFQAPSQL